MRDLYDSAREAFGNGDVHWETDEIEAVLLRSGGYSVDIAAHATAFDLGDAIVARAKLPNRRNQRGFMMSDPIVFPRLAGPACSALAIVAGDRLLVYLDDSPAFPLVPIGTDVLIEWDPRGIFRI